MEKPGSIILCALQRGRRSVWQLLSIWPYAIKELFDQLQRLHAEGWIERAGSGWRSFTLTEKGKGIVQALVGGEYVCPPCEGRGIRIPETWSERFTALAQDRPLPTAQYDQGFMRIEDTLARVAFMHQRGDLAARDLLLIGDDDLVSVAAALTSLPRRIVVIDIDRRLEQFIARINRQEGFSIEFYCLDVRDPLPPDLRGNFDTFLTDPVETLPGIELFLSRAVSSLRGRYAAGYFGLTTLSASLQKWHRIEALLLRMRLVITDLLRDFSIYPEQENQWDRFYESYAMMDLFDLKGSLPDTDWYRSSFIRVEAIDQPRPTVTGACTLPPEALYYDEESLATPRS